MPFMNRTHRIEPLEDRHMMTSIGLVNGDIEIEGSSGNDQVVVSEYTARRFNFVNGRFQVTSIPSLRVTLVNNEGTFQNNFVASQVDDIVANLGAGNDDFTNNSGKESIVHGGSGNDTLRGGRVRDVFHGENGDDTLYGRGGNDVLQGGNDNDGLFGGEGYDVMIGDAGADRILRDTQSYDYVVGVASSDAVVYFDAGNYLDESEEYGNQGRYIFQPGRWTDSEIELVDSALKVLHDKTGNDTLLELANGSSLHFVRQGFVTDTSGNFMWSYNSVTGEPEGTFVGGENDDLGHLTITEDAFLLGDDIVRQTVFHEIGHNFDERGEHSFTTRSMLDAFCNLSGWDKLSIGEQLAPGKVRSLDGEWQYNWNNGNPNMVREYGETNPREDFASTFAAYFMGSDYGFDPADRNAGVTDGRQLAPAKFALLDRMFEMWGA